MRRCICVYSAFFFVVYNTISMLLYITACKKKVQATDYRRAEILENIYKMEQGYILYTIDLDYRYT